MGHRSRLDENRLLTCWRLQECTVNVAGFMLKDSCNVDIIDFLTFGLWPYFYLSFLHILMLILKKEGLFWSAMSRLSKTYFKLYNLFFGGGELQTKAVEVFERKG